jgi:hypothetical protein
MLLFTEGFDAHDLKEAKALVDEACCLRAPSAHSSGDPSLAETFEASPRVP